jgi:hypothetical protein
MPFARVRARLRRYGHSAKPPNTVRVKRPRAVVVPGPGIAKGTEARATRGDRGEPIQQVARRSREAVKRRRELHVAAAGSARRGEAGGG